MRSRHARHLEALSLGRSVVACAVAIVCAAGHAETAQPTESSVRSAEAYANKNFGQVPLEKVSEDLLKEFNMKTPEPTEKIPPGLFKEFDQPPPVAAAKPAVAAQPAQAAIPNIYGIPEGEIAVEAGVEASASAGPGVGLIIIQPGWLERGDIAKFDLRAGPADTHARLHYDVPSDFLGAQWMGLIADYSMLTPAYQVTGAPKYRSGVVSVNWLKPFSNDFIGDWMMHWGVRLESRVVDTPDPTLASFYAAYGGKASYVVPNIGLTRVQRQSLHPLSEGKSESIAFESSVVGSGPNYSKLEYKRDQYWEVDDRVTVNLYGSVGYAKAWSKGVYPLAQRFLSTGRDSVRGFSPGTIGPTDPSGNPIGGLRKLVGSGEVYLQAGSLMDEPLYFSLFADAARIDKTSTGNDAARNYVGYGLGLTWRAPSGLVKFNFAKPSGTQPGDRTQMFLFEFKTMMR